MPFGQLYVPCSFNFPLHLRPRKKIQLVPKDSYIDLSLILD